MVNSVRKAFPHIRVGSYWKRIVQPSGRVERFYLAGTGGGILKLARIGNDPQIPEEVTVPIPNWPSTFVRDFKQRKPR